MSKFKQFVFHDSRASAPAVSRAEFNDLVRKVTALDSSLGCLYDDHKILEGHFFHNLSASSDLFDQIADDLRDLRRRVVLSWLAALYCFDQDSFDDLFDRDSDLDIHESFNCL